MDPETPPTDPPTDPVSIKELFSTLTDKLVGWVEAFVALLPNLVIAVLIVVIAWFMAKWISRLVQNAMHRMSDNRQLSSLMGSVVRVSVLASATFIALGVLQLDKTVTSLLAGVGILGIAIGFAVQDIAANLVAGTIMAVRRPFRVGDLIETNGFVAKVRAVDLRATHFTLLTGEALMLPNKDIFNSAIINKTVNGKRRIDLAVGVSYGDDLQVARDAVLSALSGLPDQMDEPAPQVFFTEFGGSSIDATVRFWIDKTNQADWLNSRSSAIMAIKRSLDDAGITIPFPIRTLDFGIVGGERLDEVWPKPQSDDQQPREEPKKPAS